MAERESTRRPGRPKAERPLETTVGVRLDAQTLARLDQARGQATRASMARTLILSALTRPT